MQTKLGGDGMGRARNFAGTAGDGDKYASPASNENWSPGKKARSLGTSCPTQVTNRHSEVTSVRTCCKSRQEAEIETENK